MPDRNILVKPAGGVTQENAKITGAGKVTFFPPDSDHAVTIQFVNRIPFSDWDCGVKTGKKGKPITGRVRRDAVQNYEYFAFSHPIDDESRPHVLGNPKLIVDGGGIGVRREKRKAQGV